MTNHAFLSRFTVIFLASLVVNGCSAHNPFIIKNTTESQYISANKYQSHDKKVLITKESLPPSAKYELLSIIEVGKVWYGAGNSVYESMATRARELGADAVIEANTWHQPAGWSWAAPHGSGKAVKFLDNTTVDLSSIKGEWH